MMKNAIASVEIYVHEPGETVRRLTLVIDQPRRADPAEEGWICRVALANLHRPREIAGPDSVSALASALGQAGRWLVELEEQGMRLTRDRAGEIGHSLAHDLLEKRR